MDLAFGANNLLGNGTHRLSVQLGNLHFEEEGVSLIGKQRRSVNLLVQEHARHPGNPYMFSSPVTEKMYGPDCVGRLHKALLKKAGITGNLRFHDLRHPYVKSKTKNFYPL